MNHKESELIESKIYSRCSSDLLPATRIHLLQSFCTPFAAVYAKREDDSGFGISGCKRRKYASIIPFLIEKNIQKVAITGGSHSNHLPGFLQLLRENQIEARLFLREEHDADLRGNRFLLDLLTAPSEIAWIPSNLWPEVEKIAGKWVAENGPSAFFIPEGGSCEAALPGALTLMYDIIRNEKAAGLSFDHIFIDSGTGLIAAALVLMNHLFERKTRIHVVLIAGDILYFSQKLAETQMWAEKLLDHRLGEVAAPVYHFPLTARSFGSVNGTVLAQTRQLAVEEGLLTDPVYTTKLFMTAREVIKADTFRGNTMIIHSGGGTGLMGWSDHFSRK
ncbi:MAG: pyridoxal-phosphate dependent enzyme [Bacteroidia bacterium]|nr:pyridoxal-phosphate dependent enzyme [Bacteroidia bacterium]